MLIIIDKIWIIIYYNIRLIFLLVDDVMEKQTRKAIIMPRTERILKEMGEQIRLARLRRKISVEMVAERAGISRASVWSVEKGSPSVSMGIYAKVLAAIGMQEDLLLICGNDLLGRELQDQMLDTRGRKRNL